MKKQVVLLLALMLVTLTACGAKPTSTPSEAPEQTYTGIVQEVKSSMLIVGPTADSADAVVFGTTEEPAVKAGDKVVVTYTGDISDVGSELNATKVELSK